MCSCLWMNIAMPREPRSRKRTDTAHARKLEILIDCWGLVRTDAVRWISGDYWVLALSQFLCWASLWCKRTCRELLLRAIKKKKKKRSSLLRGNAAVGYFCPETTTTGWMDGTGPKWQPAHANGGTGGTSWEHGCRPRPNEICPGRKGQGSGKERSEQWKG